jgi:type VI secretion system FHA domain protein
MALKLRVARYGNQPMGASAEHVFGEDGGTIGRSHDNDWVLPDSDRIVSGQHAVISYAHGEYRIRDTSTNGTFLNALALSKGDERPIHNGDHLKIGAYEISAVLDELGHAVPESGVKRAQGADMFPGTGINPAETLDPLELLSRDSGSGVDFNPEPNFDFCDRNAQSDHVSPEAMGFELPQSIPDPHPPLPKDLPPDRIPENWDETGFGLEAVAQPQLPPSIIPEAPAAGSTQHVRNPPTGTSDKEDAIATLLRSAGVPPDMVTIETYALLGEIIHVIVEGMTDVLRARAQIKDQFRVPATMLKPVENNPLKFSINAQDALHNLFGKRNPGFLSPVNAFREGFDDIKAHQMAILAGMRAAYAEMLGYFDPEALERGFTKGVRRGALAKVLNKSRHWDLYEDLYKSLTRDPDSSFHRLFGDAFARAYEEQMQRLSAVRNR